MSREPDLKILRAVNLMIQAQELLRQAALENDLGTRCYIMATCDVMIPLTEKLLVMSDPEELRKNADSAEDGERVAPVASDSETTN